MVRSKCRPTRRCRDGWATDLNNIRGKAKKARLIAPKGTGPQPRVKSFTRRVPLCGTRRLATACPGRRVNDRTRGHRWREKQLPRRGRGHGIPTLRPFRAATTGTNVNHGLAENHQDTKAQRVRSWLRVMAAAGAGTRTCLASRRHPGPHAEGVSARRALGHNPGGVVCAS
jgi:hypothetical protein